MAGYHYCYVAFVAEALERTRAGGERPYAIILDTVKGADIRDVEEIPMNHSVSIGDAQYEKWTKELGDELRALEG